MKEVDVIRCLIIDDESDSLTILESLLKKIGGVDVITKERDPSTAIKKALTMKPDLIFVDIEMPHCNGFEVIEEIRNNYSPQFVIVTAYSHYAIKAIKNEALDYILKPIDIDELKKTLDKFRKKIENERKDLFFNIHKDLLTERENEILELVLKGFTSKEISNQLYISKTTVDTHRRNMLRKLGFNSIKDLFLLQNNSSSRNRNQ